MDDEYEADLARAIELSKQESGPGGSSRGNVTYIDVDADEVDEDEARFQAELERALEESKKAQQPSSNPPTAMPSITTHAGAPVIPTAATSFLSERQQLERERLERQKRRRPDIQQSASTAPHDDSDDDEEERTRGAKRQHISSSSHIGARRANTHASASSSADTAALSARSAPSRARPATGSSASTQSIFWDGDLRQTANAHVDPQKDKRPVFRLTEILSPKEDIEFAIISAYCWNFPWVYTLLGPRTPVIAVDNSQGGAATIKTILPNWIRTTPFLGSGWSCMHMKFMLLFYRTGRLRIVISTANLIEYDWRDIENTVWVQDVPKRDSPNTAKAKEENFASTMVRVLHAVNVAPALVNFLKNDHPNLPLQRLEDLRADWDFSKVKVALIPSIVGTHEGWPKVILSGHTCLMKSLRDIGGKTPADKELVLECQGSSLGTYTTQWLNEFYRSAQGKSAESMLDMPKTRRAKLPLPPTKILFPTAQYVRDSVLGEAGGGTMFCRRAQWEGKNFPRELFHQTRSKRGSVLMHSKMVLGTFRDKRGGLGNRKRAATDSEDNDDDSRDGDIYEEKEKLVGWLYVGSHNFTPSAWGTLSGSGFNPTLNVKNYELGILIPLRSQEEIDRVACWERPPLKYVVGRDSPWIQQESPAFAETK